jgi:hypothetical protein
MGSICCGTLTLQVIINGALTRFLRLRKTIEAGKYIHLGKKSILVYPERLFLISSSGGGLFYSSFLTLPDTLSDRVL